VRTITVREPGGPEVLQHGEADMPQPGLGNVLVRVISAGVGPWDTYLRSGTMPVQVPFTPGAEFSGTVVGDTGEDAALEDGAPVYGTPGLTGCYAEYVSCPAEQLAPIPEGLDGTDAGAFPIDGLTAYQGLTEVLGLGAGEDVLITAGSGGLGHLAVQIARLLGANVIATGSPDNHDFLHELGAAEVVDHTKENWPDQVRALTSGGASKIQVCAQPTLDGAARAACDGAVIATAVPAANGGYPDAGRLDWRRYMGKPSGSNLIRMAPWIDDGKLTVRIGQRYHWGDAEAAHRDVATGHTRGKRVLIVDEDRAAAAGL
jgi:NADPH:quinone reductase-like Zn-dependent oxidoreductase